MKAGVLFLSYDTVIISQHSTIHISIHYWPKQQQTSSNWSAVGLFSVIRGAGTLQQDQ